MRAFFTADLHAHTWKSYATLDARGMNSRLLDLDRALRFTADVAVKQRVRTIYVAGDLYQVKRHVPVQATNVLYDVFSDYRHKLEWVIIPGNHDKAGDDPIETSPLVFRHVARVIAAPEADRESRVAFVPWMEDQSKVRRFLKDLKGDWELLLYHGEVRGAYVGTTDYPVPLRSQVSLADLSPEKFHWVMMGHLHRRQQLASPWHKSRGGVWYIGNPVAKDAGEREDDKGVIFLNDELSGNRNDLRIISTPYPRFVTVDLSDCRSRKDLVKLAPLASGNYAKLVVPYDVTERWVQFALDVLEPKAYDLLRLPRDVIADPDRRTDLKIGMTLAEMLDAYVDEVGGGDASLKDLGRYILRSHEARETEGRSH